MDKRILEEYIDACEVIKEAEAEIRKLESKKVSRQMRLYLEVIRNSLTTHSTLKYRERHILISDDVRIRQKKEILRQKKEKAEQLKLQVEVWLISIPFRMQRIIKYKIFEEMTWQQVADRMGRRGTAESIKKEFQRFFEKN